jgi:hypothetical protein
LLVCTEILEEAWLQRQSLKLLSEQWVQVEHLWLLVPQGTVNGPASRVTLQALRQKLSRSETIQDLHGNQL